MPITEKKTGQGFVLIVILFTVLIGLLLSGKMTADTQTVTQDLSLKNEVQHAIERGLRWLSTQPDPKGYWSQPDHPALSALVLTAFMGEPSRQAKTSQPAFIQKGYAYILKCVQPDGGIYVRELSNYNTSVSMMALVVASNPAYEPVLRDARRFLAGLQGDAGGKGKIDSPYDGGIGYGSSYNHSDMSNTLFALESLYYTRHLEQDKGIGEEETKALNWPAVIRFIERCQNLPGYNDQPWASDDPQNKGGFVYFPGNSKAGEMTLASGKTALRSYGSISYAGLLSYIYADLDRDDKRVKAVFDWLKWNYTLAENPGMGAQGLYFYYHTMAKALAAYKVDRLTLKDGKTVDWRKELGLKLLNLQTADGFWINENGRWWERDPVLVTSYAVISLEIIHQGL